MAALENSQVWFMGDPHGDFRRVLRLALEFQPSAIVFLGDLELPAPYEEVFYPIIKMGKTRLRAIHGNHDVDQEDLWRRMHDGVLARDFNLHGRVEDLPGGLRIAGLGGLFRSRIWQPPAEPSYTSYAKFERAFATLRNIPEHTRASYLRPELLKHRASIFPEDYSRLARARADVLVTHEAPGGAGFHRYGEPAIAQLAETMRVPLGFCGHHHESVSFLKKGACLWRMVDAGAIVDLDGEEIG